MRRFKDVSLEPEDGAGSITHVPGDPAISLLSEDVRIHLSIHLGTPLLDELYDKLWLVARKSGHNINPLHTHKVKGRVIIPTEDARLHLVWHRDKIYIKPVPVFLLNHDFWAIYLQSPAGRSTSERSQQASQPRSLAVDDLMALGFLRLYALLVPSRLDFALAKEAHLIPDDVKKWLQWSKFIMHFRHLVDERVARRYHYGQLRLSRLNWAVRIFRPRHSSSTWFYEIPHWSTADYIARATVPLLFLFASVSLALSAMQVSLSVPTDGPWFSGIGESGSQKMGRTFCVISITVVLGSVVIFAFLLGIPLAVFVREILWGYTKERQRRAAVSDAQVA
ncbi:hypothetical protein S7711_09766 [Stachybotrys chartarum IBT 7711]|uniref:Uncharacterized protein n=1 Tax=Stachybotrys chartarum (strain CBS 109288 / IBT 7711) TaxID=1280523 RepID=A0A084BBG5_STACB|nr:hypothetical protein S7711_09766 [Stachybotrys chartarum IBT 7711]